MIGVDTIHAIRMDLIHLWAAIAIVSTAAACGGSKDNCAQEAAGCGCHPDASCGPGLGATETGGSRAAGGSSGAGSSTGAGGSTTTDGSTDTVVPHGPCALSECVGASQDPTDCNEVCAATKQICVAGGCKIASSSEGVTFQGYKTGFQCSSSDGTTDSRESCSDGFYWSGDNFMVVRCCCADSL